MTVRSLFVVRKFNCRFACLSFRPSAHASIRLSVPFSIYLKSVFVSFFLSVCLPACLYVHHSSICLSVRLTVSLSVDLSSCLSGFLSVCLSVCSTIRPPINLSVCPAIESSKSQSVYLYLCPSICLCTCLSSRVEHSTVVLSLVRFLHDSSTIVSNDCAHPSGALYISPSNGKARALTSGIFLNLVKYKRSTLY
jgi:hypothetical protein